jgi:hypothetical protein
VKNLKLGILALGAVGLISCFLPFIKMGDVSASIWDAHSADMGQTLMYMGGFAAALVMGVLAMNGGLQRWQAIVSLVGFALVILKSRDVISHVMDDFVGIGGKLAIFSSIIGVVVSGLALAKPEKQ